MVGIVAHMVIEHAGQSAGPEADQMMPRDHGGLFADQGLGRCAWQEGRVAARRDDGSAAPFSPMMERRVEASKRTEAGRRAIRQVIISLNASPAYDQRVYMISYACDGPCDQRLSSQQRERLVPFETPPAPASQHRSQYPDPIELAEGRTHGRSPARLSKIRSSQGALTMRPDTIVVRLFPMQGDMMRCQARSLVQVMRDVEDRYGKLIAYALDGTNHFVAALAIERTERLVHEQRAWTR